MMESLGIGRTDIGMMRDQNEDRLYIDNDLGIYIVSDGMGGHAAGEEASRLAVEAAVRSIKDDRAQLQRVRQGLEDPSAAISIAQTAVEVACKTVYDAALARPELAGMGCTLTLFLMLECKAVMAHVGDTRLYLYRSGTATMLSTDHTVVAEMQARGAITAEQAAVSQLRNMLTRALGSQETVMVETLLLDVSPGDRYLLCSDGLSQYTDETLLAEHLSGELEGIAEELIAFANSSGGSDNTTVIVVSIEAEEAEQAEVTAVAGDLQVKFDTLQSVFLFEDLTLAQLQRLLNICEVEAIDAGETVTRQGERCSKMFVVLEGRVALLQDDREIAELAAGDCVGEASLMTTRTCRSSIQAKETARLLVVRRDRFASLVQKRPWFGLTLLQRMAKRSVEAADRLHDRLQAIEHGTKSTQLEPMDFF